MSAHDDIQVAIKAIMVKVKESLASVRGTVSFDFTDGPQISRVIQKMLAEKGYVVYVVFGQGVAGRTERMYIDLSRRNLLYTEAQK